MDSTLTHWKATCITQKQWNKNVLNIYRLLNVLLEKKNDFRCNEQDSQDQFTLNKLTRIAVKDGKLTNCKFANLMKCSSFLVVLIFHFKSTLNIYIHQSRFLKALKDIRRSKIIVA